VSARLLCLGLLALLAGCGGGATVPDWQVNAAQAMQAYQHAYLVGDTAAAENAFAEARSNLARTGREDLVARAELVRCATRVASLEFDGCPGFEALRGGAAAQDLAYAEYLAGKGSRAATDEPLSRLVFLGVQLRNGSLAPAQIAQAVELSSAQGWRRPLLAWLGVQLKRAQDAGDAEAAARVQRRIQLISG
jgi:hypothetical protein